mgnify:CR=1 FL=1
MRPSVPMMPPSAPPVAQPAFPQFQVRSRDAPVFKGNLEEDVEAWLTIVQDYQRLSGMTDAQKINYAVMSLQEKAQIWWNGYIRRNVFPASFAAFRQAVRTRFQSAVHLRKARAELRAMVQKGGDQELQPAQLLEHRRSVDVDGVGKGCQRRQVLALHGEVVPLDVPHRDAGQPQLDGFPVVGDVSKQWQRVHQPHRGFGEGDRGVEQRTVAHLQPLLLLWQRVAGVPALCKSRVRLHICSTHALICIVSVQSP